MALTALEKAKLMNTAFVLIINRLSSLSDADHVAIAEFHTEWTAKAYGSNEIVKYGETPAGRAQLYRSSRAVAATAPAPNVATNPVNWMKLS